MDELISALQDSTLYDHPVKSFTIIETHISWVILTGIYAYKIKKPVNFGFIDFSTLEKRQFYCAEELRLNSRFASDIYLQVIPISGSRKHPQLNGKGKAIEYAVKMKEFPQRNLLSSFARKKHLNTDHIDAMADVIAAFHHTAEPATTDTNFGSSDSIENWVEENFMQIDNLLPNQILPRAYAALKHWCLSSDQSWLNNMRNRKANGFIRHCHGDLHLGNITLINEKVTLFDCIEFNKELRWIDTISEVAFVMMDLQARKYPEFSWRFLNRYLQNCGDYAGLSIFRYYFVYRAMVRAKVAALSAQQSSKETENIQRQYCLEYLQLAIDWSKPDTPVLTIMHGLSASGKSTLALKIAEETGAIQIRSDIERKRLVGLKANEQSGSSLNQGIYSSKINQQTYQHLLHLAEQILTAGFSVIVDATFLKKNQREPFQTLALQHQLEFKIVSCQVDYEELAQRIKQRSEAGTDASEANLEVLNQQIETQQQLTRDERLFTVTSKPFAKFTSG